jgi:hypothetical protein
MYSKLIVNKSWIKIGLLVTIQFLFTYLVMYLFILETGHCYVVKAKLKFIILLLPPMELKACATISDTI